MKYDDFNWHSNGNFPQELAPEAGATHIGMFVVWSILSGLGSELHRNLNEGEVPNTKVLQIRSMTPGQFFIDFCDGKFTQDDLNDEGQEFTKFYYDKKYLDDYDNLFGKGLKSLYYVEDRWENFDLLKPVLDQRLKAWRNNPILRILRFFKR